MQEIAALISALNSLTPLGLAALLSFVIYMQIRANKGQRNIAENHLHGLPEMAASIERMTESLERIESLMLQMNNNVTYIRARINGHDL